MILIFPALCLFACNSEKRNTLFSLQDNKQLGIDFVNQLEDRKGTNVFTFRNYYNGGGVAIGDVNNDGINDVYLTSNQGDNQLLINNGKWQFENVAERAGVKGSKYWSTGVTMVDINADGWLDIYVCNSGNAQGGETENELFVNQKNGTFREEAKSYGLADRGLSTHAAFFDYDLDGDLDCYVLNNSFRPIGSFDFSKNLRNEVDEMGGDRLYRNDKGKYVPVTKEAGIYSSDIGFGLGVSVVDLNTDGYPDIFISNDFFEHDYLYINQRDGTFKEKVEEQTGHLSLASMGSDIADINNDGQYDIFTTEMLPEGDKRLKTMTSFESYDIQKAKQRDGYYNQYMQNCLQLNNGDGTFSEIAFYAGVAATDWSWGALTFDMDNDGWKDIFVSNGIYKDLTNQDYIEFLANQDNMEKIAQGKKFDFKDFTDKMKSTPVSNYAFINNKDLTFTNRSADLGLDKESFSNGAAYGDLDNDGDNDLVVNNVNMPLFVYKNNTDKANNHFIQLNLHGDSLNKNGIGSVIKTFNSDLSTSYYHQPARGFQSCIPPNMITIGLGKYNKVDSLQVIWPNGNSQVLRNLDSDSLYVLKSSDAGQRYKFNSQEAMPLMAETTRQLFDSIPAHIEDEFIDFDNERLMLQMLSTENPYLAPGDVNKDGLTDFYMGSSAGETAKIYLQQQNGKFRQYVPEDFRKQAYLETAGAVFGDFDKDGDEDLIVTYGGNAEKSMDKVMNPRFFENDGNGKLIRNAQKSINISANASVILKSDFDKDGDLDLFIGGRSVSGIYGSFPRSYLLRNDGKGKFDDVSEAAFGTDTRLGMITDAKWVDLDKNGYEDLVVTGNWMGIKIFSNQAGKFSADNRLVNYKGWWSSIAVNDVDGDGDLDIIGGNLGLNSKFRASEKEPMRIYVKDFDNNGTKECITSLFKGDHEEYVFHLRQDLVGQLPSFKKRFLKYEDYAGKTFSEVFPEAMTEGAEVHEISHLESALFINEGKGKPFSYKPLPLQAQFSAINTILCDDINSDGKPEILIAGNFYGFKPEVGRLDANYGQIYSYSKGAFTYTPPLQSGLRLNGQVRSALILENKAGKIYLFGKNNGPLTAYRINSPAGRDLIAKAVSKN
ncbi:VCBS repeat-containing protein [Flavihumibacter sp. R14]|nr:VCBS repeat-containing protein [Flavihumibacter soli]